jgi:hypothetical protein
MSTPIFRPVAGPAATMGKLQRNHLLHRPFAAARKSGKTAKKSLMELKQLWLMTR